MTVSMDTTTANGSDHDPCFGISDREKFIRFILLQAGNHLWLKHPKEPVELVNLAYVMQFQQIFPDSLVCTYTAHEFWHLYSIIIISGNQIVMI